MVKQGESKKVQLLLAIKQKATHGSFHCKALNLTLPDLYLVWHPGLRRTHHFGNTLDLLIIFIIITQFRFDEMRFHFCTQTLAKLMKMLF